MSVVRIYDKLEILYKEGFKGTIDSSVINYKSAEGHTPPIHFAIIKNDIGLVSFLLEHGADLRYRVSTGDAPLHRVCSVGMAKLLVENGADVFAMDELGRYPIKTTTCEDIRVYLATAMEFKKEERSNSKLTLEDFI